MNESPHQARQVAESFCSDAERYDRARPRYPAAMVEAIAAASPGPGVLDVGCGAGIAARQFHAVGCRVLGIDPDARMADLARRFGVEAKVAKFEDWDPAGRPFDAVIAGQAWHWVDPVAGAAKAAQVLRPGGPYTRDEWLEVVPTFGGFSQHPPAKQQELLAGIGSAIDAVGGSFTMGLHRGSGYRGAIRRRMTQGSAISADAPGTKV
jgi:SAM-dependent methyltransferase